VPLQLEVLVSVDTDEPQVISDIAAQLAQVGMDVRDVHDAISVITGTIDEAAVSSLEQVPGVLDVERQRSYRIPPPDSAVQ
jgi:hypothetical protein